MKEWNVSSSQQNKKKNGDDQREARTERILTGSRPISSRRKQSLDGETVPPSLCSRGPAGWRRHRRGGPVQLCSLRIALLPFPLLGAITLTALRQLPLNTNFYARCRSTPCRVRNDQPSMYGQMGRAYRAARGTACFGPARARPGTNRCGPGPARPDTAGWTWAATSACQAARSTACITADPSGPCKCPTTPAYRPAQPSQRSAASPPAI